ncbi:unnamed protein product [Heligmosomoides polygyrus]|uniref:Myb-like domain-containing protein n=1 Tax=Heligmosomoides polygyrus TaxID=6339 RepID=A0A183GQ03_HELPZ|nr:unnamed protein product [Heligmosomoides polygyrus]
MKPSMRRKGRADDRPTASSADLRFKNRPPRLKHVERFSPTRNKWWRLKEKEAAVISRVRLPTVTTVGETWKEAINAIRQASQSELGITKPGRRTVDEQAWLWTSDVKAKVGEKNSL